jgi:crotonobetainyl-CoA:carnitine CoA-transferase CaiB-like acyl-CoA transferase
MTAVMQGVRVLKVAEHGFVPGAAAFGQRPLAEWTDRFAPFSGQWAVVLTTREAAADPQAVASGFLPQCATAAGDPFTLVAAPVQFDRAPAQSRRAPEVNEHCNAILEGLGLSGDEVVDLTLRGVVA